MDIQIKEVNDIDNDSESGQLLIMAIAKITTESQKDKTPQEVLEQLQLLRNDVYSKGGFLDKVTSSSKEGND